MSVLGPYDATVISIHDGDTLTLAIDLGWGVTLTYPCRVYGIDAPELATQAGKDALAYIETLLEPGDAVRTISHGWDKYAPRFDGEVFTADGTDVGAAMIAAGHAVKYP